MGSAGIQILLGDRVEEVHVPPEDVLESRRRISPATGGQLLLEILHRQLRGCVGYAAPIAPLYRAVAETARAAAFDDSRFLPVTKEEALTQGFRWEDDIQKTEGKAFLCGLEPLKENELSKNDLELISKEIMLISQQGEHIGV